MRMKRTTLYKILVATSFVLSNTTIYEYVIPRFNMEKNVYIFSIMFSICFITFSIIFTDDMGHFDILWIQSPLMKWIRDMLLHICAKFIVFLSSFVIVANNMSEHNDRVDVSQYRKEKTQQLDNYAIASRSILPAGVTYIIVAVLYNVGVLSDANLETISEELNNMISLIGVWLVFLNIKADHNEVQVNNLD